MPIQYRVLLSVLLLTYAFQVEARRPEPLSAADFSAKSIAWDQHQQLDQESLFKGLQWRDIGPIVQGGRVVDIEVSPVNPYTFYVAYASGGLWKTTNNGVSFEPLFDDMPTMIMGDIAIDPNNPETIWVGTGEPNSSRSSYGGLGMYVSTDGGNSWQHRGLEATDRISRVLIDPRNSQRIMVAALGKLYTQGGERGVFISNDGGSTWENTLPGEGWTGAIDLVMNPKNPDVVYAAMWERKRTPWEFVEGGKGSGVFKSLDGGQTWQPMNTGLPTGAALGRIGLTLAASQPGTLYAAVDNQEQLPEDQWDLGDRPLSVKRLRTMTQETFIGQPKDEIERFIRSNDFAVDVTADRLIALLKNDELSMQELLDELGNANANLFNTDIKGLEIYRTDNAGESWYKTHQGPVDQVVYSYGYYFGQIRVAPDDPDRIYITGVPVVTSGDGGKTFDGSINDPSVHVDYHAQWIDPANSQHMLIGNDGGIDLTYDGGKTWIKLDAQPVGQFYHVSVDMATPYNVYGGLQDNGTLKGSSRHDWRDGEGWSRIFGGDGFYSATDDKDNQTYVGFQFGNYARLGDGRPQDVRPRDALGEEALRYNWMSPVILSPHNADIVYFGANKLFRSMDEGDTWTAISGDLSVSDKRGDVPYATITTVSESPQQFGLLWAGTDDSQVWVTTSSGDEWNDVSDGLPRNRWVTRVEASHFDRERAYVSLNGYRNDDISAYVYRTDDLGESWTDISANLPAEAVNVIKEDTVNENVLYAGTDRGAYVSLDGGGSWQSLNGGGLPNVPVHDLVIHPRDRELIAGTHGRSVWILDALPIQELSNEIQDKPLHVFYTDDVQASRGWRSQRSRWFFKPGDADSVTIAYWSNRDSDGRYEIIDENDNVLVTHTLTAQRGINTVDWDLLVDEQQALDAEQSGNSDKDTIKPKDQPYQQSVELGHPLYVLPGKYTIRLSVAGESATGNLTIKKPAPFPRRGKDEAKLRGHDKHP